MYDVAIIGSGVTAYAAAMYAARLDLSVVAIGDVEGGTITLTDDVANYPGYIQLTGKELSEKLRQHALDYPVLLETGMVTDVFRNKGNIFYDLPRQVYYYSNGYERQGVGSSRA